jgi:hypothetical protein
MSWDGFLPRVAMLFVVRALPFARIIKDTLDWLDKYLGVPK